MSPAWGVRIYGVDGVMQGLEVYPRMAAMCCFSWPSPCDDSFAAAGPVRQCVGVWGAGRVRGNLPTKMARNKASHIWSGPHLAKLWTPKLSSGGVGPGEALVQSGYLGTPGDKEQKRREATRIVAHHHEHGPGRLSHFHTQNQAKVALGSYYRDSFAWRAVVVS